MVCVKSKGSDQPAHTCIRSLFRVIYSLTVKQMTEHYLEFLILTEGYIGSSESTLVKMQHSCKLHYIYYLRLGYTSTWQNKVGEYDKEILQPRTAYQPTSPRGRNTEH